MQAGEPRDQRRTVALLELVEPRAVDDPREHFADVVRPPRISRHDAVDLGGIVERRLGRLSVGGKRLRPVQRRDDGPRQPNRVVVVFGEIVGDAGEPRVHVGAAQLLGRHLFAGGRLHEGRAGQEDGPGAVDDDGLVGHGGDVCASRRARSHHDRYLGNAGRRHPGLVEEDPAEVIAVRKHLGLERQERPARIDQVEAGQAVLEGDLLRAEVLLHGDGEVGAALDRGVVGDDHHLAAGHAADAGNQAGAGRVAVVHLPRGQGRELEKRRRRIEQSARCGRGRAASPVPGAGPGSEGRRRPGRQPGAPASSATRPSKWRRFPANSSLPTSVCVGRMSIGVAAIIPVAVCCRHAAVQTRRCGPREEAAWKIGRVC